MSNITITASAGSNGSISPTGSVSVVQHGSQIFSFIPNSNYIVDNVIVDGVNYGSIGSYFYNGVGVLDHAISVTFAQDTHSGTVILPINKSLACYCDTNMTDQFPDNHFFFNTNIAATHFGADANDGINTRMQFDVIVDVIPNGTDVTDLTLRLNCTGITEDLPDPCTGIIHGSTYAIPHYTSTSLNDVPYIAAQFFDECVAGGDYGTFSVSASGAMTLTLNSTGITAFGLKAGSTNPFSFGIKVDEEVGDDGTPPVSGWLNLSGISDTVQSRRPNIVVGYDAGSTTIYSDATSSTQFDYSIVPGPNSFQDSYAISDNSGANFYVDGHGQHTDPVGIIKRGLIRFDLVSLPTHAVITSAFLNLTVKSSNLNKPIAVLDFVGDGITTDTSNTHAMNLWNWFNGDPDEESNDYLTNLVGSFDSGTSSNVTKKIPLGSVSLQNGMDILEHIRVASWSSQKITLGISASNDAAFDQTVAFGGMSDGTTAYRPNLVIEYSLPAGTIVQVDPTASASINYEGVSYQSGDAFIANREALASSGQENIAQVFDQS